jgi:3-oxoacyl-[acyl-carrier protein] reductase
MRQSEVPRNRTGAGTGRPTVIITGAAHGIGAAYANRLVSDGWNVVIADLDGAAAEAKAKELVGSGGRALACRADISDEQDITSLIEATIDKFGAITGLVNNAAVFSVVPMSRAPYDDIPLDEWDLMLRVNVRGTWQMSRAALVSMKENGYGKIVNISSGAALKGSASRIHYVSSKAAILGLTKTLAREVGPLGVTVNCVAPGNTLSEESPDESAIKLRQARIADRALPRVQVPADLVGAVSFFLSRDSDFITGQTLVVDGGAVMH